MERRQFVTALAGAAIAPSIDIDQYLWRQKKTFFIPRPILGNAIESLVVIPRSWIPSDQVSAGNMFRMEARAHLEEMLQSEQRLRPQNMTMKIVLAEEPSVSPHHSVYPVTRIQSLHGEHAIRQFIGF